MPDVQPAVMYPKSGTIYLMSELQRLNESVAALIDACVYKDQRIAQLEAQLTLPAAMPSPPDTAIVPEAPTT